MRLSDSILKVWIWTKIVLLALVLIYIVVFVLQNTGESVRLWLFPSTEPTVPKLVALIGAFLLGSLLTILIRLVYKTIGQLRSSRDRDRTLRLEREIAEMRTKASALRTREESA